MGTKVCLLIVFLALFYVKSENSECNQFSRNCAECVKSLGCQYYANEGEKYCSKPFPTRQEDLQNDPLSEEILIRPQRIKVWKKPRTPKTFTFDVISSSSYPLDLYFLFDLSVSMNRSRATLAEQTEAIIGKITKYAKNADNIRIGFGSFVDKKLGPFKSTNDDFNCPIMNGSNDYCEQPYGFRHRVTLTSEKNDFMDKVRRAKISGDVDNPEGSLDALLQVMLCKDEIGWKSKARKVIMVATDGNYHQAMDGKLVGILHPNDGQCHLDKNGYYTQAELQDYPSVSQVNYVAYKDSFLIIFAVPKHYKKPFEGITEVIRDASVEILERDGSNIANLIERSYRNYMQEISIRIRRIPLGMRLKLQSSCNGFDARSNTCPNVPVGRRVSFTATIEACDCQSGDIDLELAGTNQKLHVSISSHQCDCKVPTMMFSYEKKSAACNNHAMACGICECNHPFCGEFCEFDNRACIPQNEGLPCSGNGICECGKCICTYPWSGEYCSCNSISVDKCLGPYSQKVCSGRGTCNCNNCKCELAINGTRASGQFCEEPICELLEPTVSCNVFNLSNSDCAKLSIIKIDHDNPILNQGQKCIGFHNDCEYFYTALPTQDGELEIFVHLFDGKVDVCSPNPRIAAYQFPKCLAIFFCFIFLPFLIPLIILQYRWWINRKSTEDYEIEIRETRMKTNLLVHGNPTFKPATTTFKNPTFGWMSRQDMSMINQVPDPLENSCSGAGSSIQFRIIEPETSLSISSSSNADATSETSLEEEEIIVLRQRTKRYIEYEINYEEVE